eukprot:684746-Prorocentrum_minimum.AAC.1
MQKVQQEEDERQRTTIANKTAMAAIGDARWAKWAAMANKPKPAPTKQSEGAGGAGGQGSGASGGIDRKIVST